MEAARAGRPQSRTRPALAADHSVPRRGQRPGPSYTRRTAPRATKNARGHAVAVRVARLQHRIGAYAPTTPSVTHRPATGTPGGNPSRTTGAVAEGNLRPARAVHPGGAYGQRRDVCFLAISGRGRAYALTSAPSRTRTIMERWPLSCL